MLNAIKTKKIMAISFTLIGIMLLSMTNVAVPQLVNNGGQSQTLKYEQTALYYLHWNYKNNGHTLGGYYSATYKVYTSGTALSMIKITGEIHYVDKWNQASVSFSILDYSSLELSKDWKISSYSVDAYDPYFTIHTETSKTYNSNSEIVSILFTFTKTYSGNNDIISFSITFVPALYKHPTGTYYAYSYLSLRGNWGTGSDYPFRTYYDYSVLGIAEGPYTH